MAAAPRRSESNSRSVVPLDPLGLPCIMGNSKKRTSSTPNNELQIRRENHVNRPESPVSRRRALNFAMYEIITRIQLSIRGDDFAMAAASSRPTARRWSENDLFNTTYKVWRFAVAKRSL